MLRSHIILLTLLLLSGATPLIAQARRDSTAAIKHPAQRSGAKFIDEDGDGVDDRMVGRNAGYQRGRDRFIDSDGDGICDGRANGLGFRRGAQWQRATSKGEINGHGKQQGKKP